MDWDAAVGRGVEISRRRVAIIAAVFVLFLFNVVVIGNTITGMHAHGNTGRCPPGWQWYDGHCYGEDSEKREAGPHDACEFTYVDAYPVTINDAAENKWVYEAFSVSDHDPVHIGIHDFDHDGSWEWPGPDSDYTNWMDREGNHHPYQGQNIECAEIAARNSVSDGYDYQWKSEGPGGDATCATAESTAPSPVARDWVCETEDVKNFKPQDCPPIEPDPPGMQEMCHTLCAAPPTCYGYFCGELCGTR